MASKVTDVSDSGLTPEDDTPVSGATPRRDSRPYIYAALDVLLAAFYAYVLFSLIPNRHGWVQVLSALVVLSPVVMAGSMVLRRSWSWWSAVVACGLLLVLALAFLVLIVLSASFLAGVYGAIGQAASAVALIGAALVVEFMGVVPALQMKFLMTRAGRRCFGKEPLWKA